MIPPRRVVINKVGLNKQINENVVYNSKLNLHHATKINLDTGSTRTTVNPSFSINLTNVQSSSVLSQTATGQVMKSSGKGALTLRCENDQGGLSSIDVPNVDIMDVTEPLLSGKDIITQGKIVLANPENGGCYIEKYDNKEIIPIKETSMGFYLNHLHESSERVNNFSNTRSSSGIISKTTKQVALEEEQRLRNAEKERKKAVKENSKSSKNSSSKRIPKAEELELECKEREDMWSEDTLPRVVEKRRKKQGKDERKKKALSREQKKQCNFDGIDADLLSGETLGKMDVGDDISKGLVEDMVTGTSPDEDVLLEKEYRKGLGEDDATAQGRELSRDVDIAKVTIAKLWDYFLMQHRRWNHLSFTSLALLLRRGGDMTPYIRLFCMRKVVKREGKSVNQFYWFKRCEDCLTSTSIQSTTSGSDPREEASGPREITCIDFIPTLKPTAVDGSSAKLLVKDKYSKLVKSYPIEAPTTTEAIKALRKYMIAQGGVILFRGKKIRSDNDKCFGRDNVEWNKFCDIMEWESKNSPSYRHDFNGEIESFAKSHGIKERTMMMTAGVPFELWNFASTAQCEVSNCSVVTASRSRYSNEINRYHSPYQRFWGRSIDINHIKVFGCSAMVPLRVLSKDKELSSKFKERKIKCCYLGPSEHSSYGTGVFGYIREGESIKNLRFKEAHMSDVDWLENEFYFKDKGYDGGLNLPMDFENGVNNSNLLRSGETDYNNLAYEVTSLEDWSPENAHTTDLAIRGALMMVESQVLRDQDLKPGVQDMSYSKFKNSVGAERENWDKPLRKEWQGFKDTHLYKEIQVGALPRNTLVTKLKTIFEIKKSGDYKVRSVVAWVERLARSIYRQGLPDAYSPASKLENVRMVMAAESYLRKKQEATGQPTEEGERYVRMAIDIKQAFLNGEFTDDSVSYYVHPPEGFYEFMEGKEKPGVVWLLLRPLYGLPVSGRLWYLKFKSLIERFGACRLDKEACMFYKLSTDGNLIALMNIHVDDSYMIGKKGWLDRFVEDMKTEVTVTELGDTDKHLGMEIKIDNDGDVSLSQYQTTMNLLEEHGIIQRDEEGKVISKGYPKYLPMPATTKLEKTDVGDTGIVLDDVVGSLLWIMRTCNPALGVYTSMLGSQVRHPTKKDYMLAKRVMNWMLGFPNAGLRFKADIDRPPLEVFVDAELGGQDKEGKKLRSRGGFVIYMWGQVVHYRSRKHGITSTSTFDSEIRTIMEVLEKALVMKANLVQLGLMKESEAILVHSDSETAVKTLNNPLGTEKTGHLEFDDFRKCDENYEFDLQYYLLNNPEQTEKLQEKLLISRVAELIDQKKVRLVHVPGVDNISDFLTKCLGAEKLYWCLIRCMCLDTNGKGKHANGICDCISLPNFKSLRKKEVAIS